MNLKLLEKLVKLANNNPNDNEANLAARKACKMITEGNFIYTPDVPKQEERQPPYKSPYNAPGFSGVDWGGGFDWYSEFVRQAQRTYQQYGGQDRSQWSQTGQQQQQRQRQYEREWEQRYAREYPSQEPKPKRDKREMKCNQCGGTFQTTFVGPEFNFTCGNCQWTRYNEEKK